jgi:hypothetical protein
VVTGFRTDGYPRGLRWLWTCRLLHQTLPALHHATRRHFFDVPAQRALRIQAQAESQLPFEHLEIVVNGSVVRSVPSASSGRQAKLEFDLPVKGPAWIAARALGARHPEIIFYPRIDWSHPVVAHTSPVWIRGGRQLAVGESAEFMLKRVLKLEVWARDEAYFGDEERRRDALATIQRGIDCYRQLPGGDGRFMAEPNRVVTRRDRESGLTARRIAPRDPERLVQTHAAFPNRLPLLQANTAEGSVAKRHSIHDAAVNTKPNNAPIGPSRP